MLQAFAAAFRTPDLRRKLLFSLAIIAVYRLGAAVPGPGVSVEAINSCLDQAQASDQRDLYSLVLEAQHRKHHQIDAEQEGAAERAHEDDRRVAGLRHRHQQGAVQPVDGALLGRTDDGDAGDDRDRRAEGCG